MVSCQKDEMVEPVNQLQPKPYFSYTPSTIGAVLNHMDPEFYANMETTTKNGVPYPIAIDGQYFENATEGMCLESETV